MKRINHLIITSALTSVFLLSSPQSARAMSCYAANVTPDVTAAVTTPVMGAIAMMQQVVASAVSAASQADSATKAISDQQAATQESITDAKDTAKDYQDKEIRKAERAQDAMVQGYEVNTPTLLECSMMTTQIATDGKLLANTKAVRQITDRARAMLKTGAPNGGPAAYRAQRQAERLKARKEGGAAAAKYSPNARAECPDAKCYNDFQLMRMDNNIALPPKELPLTAARTNVLGSYEDELFDWQNEYVASLDAIDAAKPGMMADVENFNAAVNYVQSINPSANAAEVVKAKFPYGDKTGISYYELLEFQKKFAAKEITVRSSNTSREQYMRAAEALKQIQDEIAAAEKEKAAYERAMSFMVSNAPPEIPTGAAQQVQ